MHTLPSTMNRFRWGKTSSSNIRPQSIAVSPGDSEESVWKAAYGAARIAVDIAKDSLDMFPPVKAVTVALSVLIKNFDVGPTPAFRHIDR